MYGWLRIPIYRMMIRNETKLFRGSNASIFGRVWIAAPLLWTRRWGTSASSWPTASSHPSRNIAARFSENASRGESRLRRGRLCDRDVARGVSEMHSRWDAWNEMKFGAVPWKGSRDERKKKQRRATTMWINAKAAMDLARNLARHLE